MLPGAVIYASDVDRLRRFYERVCDLTPVDAGHDFTTLRGGSVELHLVAVPDPIRSTITLTDPPRRRAHTPVKPVFAVADLAAARELAVGTGGRIDDPADEWRHGDAVVCDGHDPEGNVVQLRAPAR